MSSPAVQTREPALQEPVQSAVPRKRRRRAPVTGAAEDCFTCRKRNTKCDRRRPYCSQCIDLGKDCSGYRTTLTWGVGVASRGKLRGLSLPVPKSPSSIVAGGAGNNNSAGGAGAGATAGAGAGLRSPRETKPQTSAPVCDASSLSIQSGLSAPSDAGSESHTHSPPTQTPGMGSSSADYSRFDATSPIPIPTSTLPPHLGWHVPGFSEHSEGYASQKGKLDRTHFHHPGPLQKLHTSLASAYGLGNSFDDAGLSASTGSISAYSDSEFSSPSDFPQTPDDYAFVDSGFPPLNALFVEPRTPMSSTESLGFNTIPRSYPSGNDDMSSSLSSDQSHHDYPETPSSLHHHHQHPHHHHHQQQQHQPQPQQQQQQHHHHHPHGQYGPSSFNETIYESGVEATAPCSPPQRVYPHYQQIELLLLAENASNNPAVLPADGSNVLAMSPNIHPGPHYALTPRMQYLLDYYDKVICPALVAFDGPTNPYRMHVLPLAVWNEGLQNAIAALATNNMRMRGGMEARRLGWEDGSSVLPEHAYSRVTAQELREMQGEPTAEELGYKAASIQLLNAQLADPTRAKDDSVLATLLVLCLFHVCDSGFTKFKTQLAGVQKLLSLRNRSVQSNFVGWIEMFFTWFDVMTSCVNDRETQIRGDSFDILNVTANLGALEHLAGCEGRLFRLIARLGRLNLLSQNRPVRERLDPTPRATPLAKRARDYYSLSYDRIDGNGWGTPVVETPPSPGSTCSFASPSPEDTRHEFWAEWHEIRSRLQEWELEVAPASPTSPAVPTRGGSSLAALDRSQRDLLHISESFRFSALLYMERLAHPNLPSSALNLQNLVAQSLYHISHIGITSCVNKFLLWPLFITGTECVDPNHRAIIRQRCIEIQRESGFFNNLSGLEVLEKVWREADDDLKQDTTPIAATIGGQAFKWRNAMNRVDGEYVIV